MKNIRNLTMGGLILGMMTANTPTATAGDREWAVVGKVLTGFAIASAVQHHPHVTITVGHHPPPPMIVAPPSVCVISPPVMIVPPRPVFRPAPVVMHRPLMKPAPVVVYRPAPRFHGHPVFIQRVGNDRDNGRSHGHR